MLLTVKPQFLLYSIYNKFGENSSIEYGVMDIFSSAKTSPNKFVASKKAVCSNVVIDFVSNAKANISFEKCMFKLCHRFQATGEI